MNKILNNIVNIGKSFFGLVIYFAVSIIFVYIIKSIPNLTPFTYSILLIISEIVTAGLLIIVYRKKLKKDFIDFDKNYKKYLSFGFKIWLIGIIVMIVSNTIIYNLITNNIAYNQELNIMAIQRYPLYSVIAIIMIGPFVEEIVYRLSFKEALKSKTLYYILTVFIFASMHVLNGITSPLELLYYIPYGALAIAFSYILDKTDNIFTTTIIHTFHNALSIVLIIIAGFLGV